MLYLEIAEGSQVLPAGGKEHSASHISDFMDRLPQLFQVLLQMAVSEVCTRHKVQDSVENHAERGTGTVCLDKVQMLFLACLGVSLVKENWTSMRLK